MARVNEVTDAEEGDDGGDVSLLGSRKQVARANEDDEASVRRQGANKRAVTAEVQDDEDEEKKTQAVEEVEEEAEEGCDDLIARLGRRGRPTMVSVTSRICFKWRAGEWYLGTILKRCGVC